MDEVGFVLDKVGSPKKVLRWRDAIVSQSLAIIGDSAELSVEQVEELANVISEVLPSRCDRAAIVRSLQPWLSAKLTPKQLMLIAWLLAANTERLAQYQRVLQWRSQPVDEWVATRLEAICPVGPKKFTAKLRVLTGSPAGEVINWSISEKASYGVSLHLGFKRPPDPRSTRMPERIFHNIRELVGMQLDCLVSSELSGRAGRPELDQWRVRASQLSSNRELINARDTRTRVCPQGKPASVACFNCVAGTVDCELAVHPFPMTKRVCKKCGKESVFADYVSQQMCYLCVNKRKE